MLLLALSTALLQTQSQPIGAARIAADADRLGWLASTPLSREFLTQAKRLTDEPNRKLYQHKTTKAWLRESQWKQLAKAEMDHYALAELDSDDYYQTKYGSPLTYLPAMEILGRAGLTNFKGKRVMDFGYGMIGQLRIWSLMGASTTGIDVDPFLRELYSFPQDQGRYGKGSVQILTGFFPTDPAIARAAGGGYDLIVSKNTLKLGYIHPRREAKKEQLIDLGVSDEQFVRELWNRLKLGGYVLVYNISPAQNPLDKPYIPWADGETAFARSIWEKQGFKVLAFDANDDVACHAAFKAIGYGNGPVPLKSSVFTHYTLVQKL
jgi:hypothetical protein